MGGKRAVPERSNLAVVAVGGNSLISDAAHKTVPDQYAATVETTRHVVDMIQDGWRVVLTHGNGPQIGFILRRSELSLGELHPVPMDAAGADTQGAIGYMFQKALLNEFRKRGIQKPAVTVVTQVLVDSDDPAFKEPTKPIGSHMDKQRAERMTAEAGWIVREDAGRGWRRVVPSPIPRQILELDSIVALVQTGAVVIAVGGGGIPVMRDGQKDLVGVDAVIDKDLASSLLAQQLRADVFVISTAVEQVALNFNKPDQQNLTRVTLSEARDYLKAGHFLKGSMEPKVRALIEFLEAGGDSAVVTNPPNLTRAMRGEAGTTFVRG
jgi:carbamate kinase